MLALTRKPGEEIVISVKGKRVGTVRVASVHGDKVVLAFDFPRQISIDRAELAKAVGR